MSACYGMPAIFIVLAVCLPAIVVGFFRYRGLSDKDTWKIDASAFIAGLACNVVVSANLFPFATRIPAAANMIGTGPS